MQKIFLFLFAIICVCSDLHSQSRSIRNIPEAEDAIVGASRLELYLSDLQNKNVGVVANQTSIFNNTHLIDTLLSEGVVIKKIFTPEHGFRGSADEGAVVNNSIDEKTQLPIISLYGNNKKPNSTQLEDIDILLFDLQDVGTRFYTYISTMTYIMEAAAENNIPVIVLDRPNPNGFYIDGPVLEKENTSFVGLHQVPVVYGLTIGEYALMVNGEYWLKDSLQCDLKVVPLGNYDRKSIYRLTVKPSPNLPNWESVYLYPSLCFFEGTIVSVGRGTETPFQVYGHPDMNDDFSFTPRQAESRKEPLLCNKECFGENLLDYAHNFKNNEKELNLTWIINAYNQLKDNEKFFNNFFIKLAGTDNLRKQIIEGLSEDEIRASWKEDLEKYKKIRVKYLLYKD
ncbi:MAG: DUF1343 domain-containing protein [Bacteroidales bacterium]|nr:DUF1343 domain-containing protein [Bacteroidales bacterium]MBQ8223028.1 DUF1343 domain-containing protein [Bacteroidales bacterium]